MMSLIIWLVIGMLVLSFQLEIDWDDILQDDSSRGMFDMELEDTMNEGEEVGLVFVLTIYVAFLLLEYNSFGI